MIIEEIMTEDVAAVDADMSVTEVAAIVAEKRIHGVPVIDKERKVLGIITETDFFNKDSSNMLYIPQMINAFRDESEKVGKEENKVLESVVQVTAKDIMTKNCLTVHPETSIEEFIVLIKKNGFNTFPVTNDEGVLVGIVTVFDMIKRI